MDNTEQGKDGPICDLWFVVCPDTGDIVLSYVRASGLREAITIDERDRDFLEDSLKYTRREELEDRKLLMRALYNA
jgi:hypothetical protein